MWSRVWRLLRDKGNRRVLTFLGGAVAVVAGGLWTAVTFLADEKPSSPPSSTVVEQMSTIAGHDTNIHAPVPIINNWEVEEEARKRAEQEKRAALEQELRRQGELADAQARERKQEQERRVGFEARRPKILETGYSLLKDIGGEEQVYGLYSYAILVNDSDRSAKFLGNVFGDRFNAIPPIEETVAQPSQTNILYIPLKLNKAKEWSKGLKLGKQATLRAAYAKNFYDYKMSRTLLNHLCVSPAIEIRRACEGDLSRGPYIFAYARPASKVTPVPPPFLFMDLSDVHERAFPEIIAAFRAQVKRDDISDRAKIDTLRLKLLSIVLAAGDWLVPVQRAIADIVHSPGGQTEKDKK
jgi:hypothetical protein